MSHHREGSGSKLIKAVIDSGNNFEIARTFLQVDRRFERWLKNQKNAAQFCPLCNENPRVPKKYVPPPVPQKRPYRSYRFDGFIVIQEVIISSQELLDRLRQRVKVGMIIHVGNKKYLRTNKQIEKSFWKLIEEISPVEVAQPIEIQDKPSFYFFDAQPDDSHYKSPYPSLNSEDNDDLPF